MTNNDAINEISEKLEYNVKPIISQYVKQHEVLYNAFYDAFSNFTNKASDVHFAGKNNFLKQPEFSNIEKVKEIQSMQDAEKYRLYMQWCRMDWYIATLQRGCYSRNRGTVHGTHRQERQEDF